MKKFFRKIVLVCALLTLALASLSLYACESDGYTVYVKDAEGNAYTEVTVQVCATGNSSFCDQNFRTVDKNGKVVVPALHTTDPVTGNPTDEVVEEVVVHLYTPDGMALPGNITYEEVTVKLGKSVTVVVTVA